MQPSKELKAMSIENSPKTGVTAEGQAAAKRIAANRAERNANPTSVTADQLSQPVSQVTVPQPGQVTGTSPRTNALVGSTLGGIRSMSESAQGLRDQNEQLNAFSEDFSATGLNEQFLNKFGVTEERMGRLEQLENELNSYDAESKIVQSRIASAPGQTAGQAGREITQEERELAVRSAEKASEAEILRGNIELGRELARDAVNLAITDRNFKANSMIRQIKSLEGIVDEETSQLLVAEERQYTEIKDRGEELRTSITDAVSSGAATPEEVRQLNALSEPQRADESTEQYFARVRAEDAAKLALAQSIVSRGKTQMRDLEVRESEASIRANNASASRSETGRLLDLAEAGDEAAIKQLGLTVNSTGGEPTADEIAFARQFASTGTVPAGLSSAGVSFGDIAELASDLPKPDGAIVDRNTNVASSALSSADNASFDALYNAINTDLPAMIEAFTQMNQVSQFGEISEDGSAAELSFGTGIVGGIQNTINPSEASARFDTIKADFTAKLVLARSGAAATEDEVNRYLALVPSRFNTPLGIGKEGDVQLSALENQMTSALDDKLNTRGLSIYGYSTVEVGSESYTVGEIITSEYGQRGRVNPDGSITEINN